MLKRNVSVAVAAALALSLAACGSTADTVASSAAGTTATAEGSSNNQAPDVKVGAIILGDETEGYSAAHINGIKEAAAELGMSDEEVQKMTWLGISGIANVLCCIKMAKYYELTENDVVGTVLTDSAVMYQSRIEELNQMYGAYNAHEASLDHNLHMLGLKTDSMLELTYTERKRVHNLKYYTWVEQQQMNVEDLNAQWYDTKNTWDAVHAQAKELDELINEFNEATGLLKAL